MKNHLVFSAALLLAGSLIAADSSPKEELTAAAKKLAAADNYSWKVTADFGPNSQFTPGPTRLMGGPNRAKSRSDSCPCL